MSATARGAAANVHGWLLVLPAAALLVLFTHYPTVATFLRSFFPRPRARAPPSLAWITTGR
jgi:sn-glycerol 3-phosphate transport system permease protein